MLLIPYMWYHGDMECRVSGCGREAIKMKCCNRHYRRLLRHGDPEAGAPLRGSSPMERIEHKGFDVRETCHLWRGHTNSYGYGQIKQTRPDGTIAYLSVHRITYANRYGDIAEGLNVDHTCHNEAMGRGECDGGLQCWHRRCINPDHLRAVTIPENLAASPRRGEMISRSHRSRRKS